MDCQFRANIPAQIQKVIKRILEFGGQAYIVGGAVRSALLNLDVMDWDIATSLLPDEVERLFADARTIPTGKKFGTVTVILDGMPVEITTYRGEGPYSDSRHPDEVFFVSDIGYDLSRRDFTINAMAYNPFLSLSLIDPFGGVRDLKEGLIRTVGRATDRFTEDPLRMMRAARFAAQLNFALESSTQKAMAELAHLIRLPSKERIRDEINKILLSPHPAKGLSLLEETGLLKWVLPVIHRSFQSSLENSDGRVSIGEHSLQVIENCRADLILRLAALFHDTGKVGDHSPKTSGEIAEASLTDLRYDKKSTHRVVRLIGKSELKLDGEKEQVTYQLRKLLGSLGYEDTLRLFELHKANLQSSGSPNREEEEKKVKEAFQIIRGIVERKEPLCISDLAINGRDLLEIGIGKKDKQDIGKALNEALEWVLQNPGRNEKDYLLTRLKTLFG